MSSIARKTALVAALVVLLSACGRADVPLFSEAQTSMRIADVTACLNRAGIPFRLDAGNVYVATDRREAALRALNTVGAQGRHPVPDEAGIRSREADAAHRQVALDERVLIEECRLQPGVRDCWVGLLGVQGAVLVVDGEPSLAVDPLRALAAVTLSVPADHVTVLSPSGIALAAKPDPEREKTREKAQSAVEAIVGRDQAVVGWAGSTLVVLLRDPSQRTQEGKIRAACKIPTTVTALDDLAGYLPARR